MSEWHYYEVHVTIDPVTGPRIDQLVTLCEPHGFRVADLLMRKSMDPNAVDDFCSARDPTLAGAIARMLAFIASLHVAGFVVRRYKVEYTLFDSRYDDRLCQLPTRSAPLNEPQPIP